MIITYTQNPLASTVELNDLEKAILWHRVKIKKLEELLFQTHFYLSSTSLDIDRARKEADPDYYCPEIGRAPIDTGTGRDVAFYLEDLKEEHIGDCVCFPCSCTKCGAESILGIDTIKGLGKHEANLILKFFRQDSTRTAVQVLSLIEEYEVIPTQDWHLPHVDRWIKERENAREWMIAYIDNTVGKTVELEISSWKQ